MVLDVLWKILKRDIFIYFMRYTKIISVILFVIFSVFIPAIFDIKNFYLEEKFPILFLNSSFFLMLYLAPSLFEEDFKNGVLFHLTTQGVSPYFVFFSKILAYLFMSIFLPLFIAWILDYFLAEIPVFLLFLHMVLLSIVFIIFSSFALIFNKKNRLFEALCVYLLLFNYDMGIFVFVTDIFVESILVLFLLFLSVYVSSKRILYSFSKF